MRSETAVQATHGIGGDGTRLRTRILPRSNQVSWAWLDLNQRPHPETKIARVPTGSAAREPSLAGQARFSSLVAAPGHAGLIRDRGLSAVRTGVSPGRARASGAKGCILSDLVPSGTGKPGDSPRLVRDSRTVKVLRRLGLTSSCRADPSTAAQARSERVAAGRPAAVIAA